jgi:hypothetical protein
MVCAVPLIGRFSGIRKNRGIINRYRGFRSF